MSKLYTHRDIATEIKMVESGRVEKLTYIGSGTFCNVYYTESKDVIKEFAPKIKVKNKIVDAMTRKKHNGELTPLETLSSFHLKLIQERRAVFDSEVTVIDELNSRYRDDNDNMFFNSKDMPNTSLGRCHWCNYVGGDTLDTIFTKSKEEKRDFKQHFLYVLPFIISLYDEIAFYHGDNDTNVSRATILNLDIKPDNLFAIKSQGQYIGIRNLDFSSTRRIEDKKIKGKRFEYGLVSSIQKYAKKLNYVVENEDDLLIDQIASKFFASSPSFYDNRRIKDIINNCLIPSTSKDSIISDLKLLDILAAWKTFLFAFCDFDELDIGTDENKHKNEINIVKKIFAEIFENNQISSNNSLFESYYIYTQLYEIMARSFVGTRKYRLSASEIANRLRNILCILNGVSDDKKTQEQRHFEDMNRAFIQQDKLLLDNGLKSIKDILAFCKSNEDKGIRIPENLGKLQYFLTTQQNIDFRLFPDVVFNKNTYSNYDNKAKKMLADANVPFLRAYNTAKDNLKLLLIGSGSLGKSTSLRVFKAEMLSQNIPCLIYECKHINLNDITRLELIAQQCPSTIFVFDAYDEIQESIREYFNEFIDKLNDCQIRVIVSSRFDPRTGYVSEATSEIFSIYKPIYIHDFTDEQLDGLVSNTISRNSGYYSLLKNTMFLSLHLELEKNNLADRLNESIKTEAAFIKQYFELLYIEKLSKKVNEQNLIDLGKYVHNQRKDKTKDKTNRNLVEIPQPLNHIFQFYTENKPEKKVVLTSEQIKYLNYLHALYLKDVLLDYCYSNDNEGLIESASKLLNMPSTSEISESVYYTGQLLENDAEAKKIIIALNSSKAKNNTRYENVLSLFLGYNNDVAQDIPKTFEFYHQSMMDNPRNYIHACDRIRELRANSIKDVKFGACGFSQLEKIDIDNDIYYTKGNCLLKKRDNGLYVGCSSSVIPDGVTYIHTHAFSHCGVKTIIIPSSTLEIDTHAFLYCNMLENVEIGENVNKINREAFYKCSAIKTLHIKNTDIQIGDNAYNKNAFVGVCQLENAIVPTSGIGYVYKFAAETLSYLEVFQGYSNCIREKLSFDCIKHPARFNALKKLYIRKDVEEISEEAFIQLANNLESIEVENGCKNYYSIDNCLISNQNQTLILGCKNSIIPKNGVNRLKSYAFARCEDLLKIDIPENIVEIGYNCFIVCSNLKTVLLKSPQLKFGDWAFNKCRNIKEVHINKLENWLNYKFISATSNPLFYSEKLVINGDNKGEVVLPNVTKINDRAFNYAKNIKTLHIPPQIRAIGHHAFVVYRVGNKTVAKSKNLKKIYIFDLKSWCTIDFANYSANPLVTGAALFLNKKEINHLVIDSEISLIKMSAFIRCSSLRTITFIGDNTIVESEAFLKCPNLTTITIHGKSSARIHPSAFRGCNATIKFVGTESEFQEFTKSNSFIDIKSIVLVKQYEL